MQPTISRYLVHLSPHKRKIKSKRIRLAVAKIAPSSQSSSDCSDIEVVTKPVDGSQSGRQEIVGSDVTDLSTRGSSKGREKGRGRGRGREKRRSGVHEEHSASKQSRAEGSVVVRRRGRGSTNGQRYT